MPNDPTYSLSELADLAGVSPRTVRYYIAQGLLAAPGALGPGTRYPAGHLARLRLIKELQREHLPLAEIRTRLAGLTDEEVATLAAAAEPAPVADTAIDYIRSLLEGRTSVASDVPLPTPAAPSTPALRPVVSAPDRSQWDRVLLAPDIELHVRRPLSRLQNKRVERLIAIARELLEEDPK